MLKYNKLAWLTVDGFGEHWEKAEIYVAIQGDSDIVLDTNNVSDLTIYFPPGSCPLDKSGRLVIAATGDGVDFIDERCPLKRPEK